MDKEAVKHESNFWEGFVKTDRFIKGWLSDERTPELQQTVYDFIKQHPEAMVLDVGSGVASILTGTVPHKYLFPVDPLADQYEKIFDYSKYPLVPRPTPCAAEGIPEFFQEQYDIVHCSNALDHTQNPVKAFQNMLFATKKGGNLIIQCFENEAIYEKYQGFHQYNITLPDHLIRIEDKQGNYSFLTGDFEVVKTEKVKFGAKTWFIWIAKKLA